MSPAYLLSKLHAAVGAQPHMSSINALGLGISTASLAYVLIPHSASSGSATHQPSSPTAWEEEEEEVAQQAVSEACVEAAPYLRQPHQDLLVTVLAGGVSGAAAKTAVAPLARLTILYQVQALQQSGGKVPGLMAAMQQVVRQEGFKALWKGNLATIIHRVPYSAVNFTTFELAKASLEPHVTNDVLRRLAAGAASGLVACTAAYPLDLVRTRLSAQRDMLPQTTRLTSDIAHGLGVTPNIHFPTPLAPGSTDSMRPCKNYRGIMHAFRCIMREEGPRGLYRGLGATLAQVTPSLALNFCLYDSFRAFYLSYVTTTTPSPAPAHVTLSTLQQQPSTMDSPAAHPLQHTQLRRPAEAVGSHSPASRSAASTTGSSLQQQQKQQQQPLVAATSSSHSQPQSQNHRLTTSPPSAHQQPTSSSPTSSSTGSSVGADGLIAGPGRGADGVEADRPGEGQAGAEGVQGRPGPLNLTGSLVCAAGAGFVTSTLTFPLDVIRKRMQTERGGTTSNRLTYYKAFAQVLSQQGLRGFYSGIVPEYCKVLPGMAIAFAMYEGIRSAGGVQHRS